MSTLATARSPFSADRIYWCWFAAHVFKRSCEVGGKYLIAQKDVNIEGDASASTD